MSVIERLTAVIRAKSYVCQFCRLSFDSERGNCPACGCDRIEPSR